MINNILNLIFWLFVGVGSLGVLSYFGSSDEPDTVGAKEVLLISVSIPALVIGLLGFLIKFLVRRYL